jgi:two-component system sensor histidine kinase UhpB
MLRKFWHGRSIRLQLLVVFALVDLFAALLSSSVIILRARTQTRNRSVGSTRRTPGWRCCQTCESTGYCRRILADTPHTTSFNSPAPAWFAALVAPAVEPHDVPVTVAGKPVGHVEIRGEPADEIAEIWENFIAIGSLAALLNLAMLAILYFLFGRVLDPLTGLAVGLSDLQHESYAVRLPQPHPRELAAIVDQFNALANALETVRAENLALNRQLIRAQDDERRRTALELHDEVGPCLFGLKVCAASIDAAATELPDKIAIKCRSAHAKLS